MVSAQDGQTDDTTGLRKRCLRQGDVLGTAIQSQEGRGRVDHPTHFGQFIWKLENPDPGLTLVKKENKTQCVTPVNDLNTKRTGIKYRKKAELKI